MKKKYHGSLRYKNTLNGETYQDYMRAHYDTRKARKDYGKKVVRKNKAVLGLCEIQKQQK